MHSATMISPSASTPQTGNKRVNAIGELENESTKKVKTNDDCCLFPCLVCRKDDCKYENGHTVFVEESMPEHDPTEARFGPYNSPRDFKFDRIRAPIKTVAAAVLQNHNLWSRHKCIGSTSLELKLRDWMKRKIKEQLVVDFWDALRRAAKEALRYRRQLAEESMKMAYLGESSKMRS